MESQIDKFNARARKRKEILEQRKQQQQAASHESAEDEQKRKQREEEQQKQREEEQKRKQKEEQERQKEEEKRRLEEQKRKLEEEKRRLEEERIRQEEENKRLRQQGGQRKQNDRRKQGGQRTPKPDGQRKQNDRRKQGGQRTPKPDGQRKQDNRRQQGNKSMADTINWNEELQKDETFLLAQKLGIDVSSFNADSEEAKKSSIEEIKKKIKEFDSIPSTVTPTPEEQALFDRIKKEKLTLTVNQDTQDNPIQNSEWIKQKRAFYNNFATDQGLVMINDPAKDSAENTFSCSFEKAGNSLGEVKYTSPTSVKISENSDLVMYQAIIKDALTNNLRIELGNSLSDKQKAMLFAAALTSKNQTYNDGTQLEIKNPPKIDINADYFKTLPQNMQDVLKKYDEEEKARQASIEKIKQIRARIEAKAKALGKKTTELSETEYREAMYEGMTDEQKQARQKKLDDREKVLAAYLGFIPAFEIERGGKKVKIEEDDATRDLVKNNLPERYAALKSKYERR